MLPLISTMSVPASMTIETAPAVIWAMIVMFVFAALGISRAASVARTRARREAAELELLSRVVARHGSATSNAANRQLAA